MNPSDLVQVLTPDAVDEDMAAKYREFKPTVTEKQRTDEEIYSLKNLDKYISLLRVDSQLLLASMFAKAYVQNPDGVSSERA